MISTVQPEMNSVGSFISLQDLNQEVKIFIEEAQKAFEMAETEISFGNTVRTSALRKAQNNGLRMIALWHYQNGLEKLRQAIKNLEQAICFNPIPKCRQFINSKMNEYLKNMKKVLAYQQKLEGVNPV